MDSKAATEREVARIKKQIDDVDKEIKELAQGIAAAEEEWIKGGSESDRKYWQEKGLLLVKEKGDFQKEKGRLLKKEQELREWMLGITPTASAARRGPYGEAGTCTDLEMQDVDHGDTDYAGPSASGGPAGRGQQLGDRFRSSGENPWSTEVDMDVRRVLERAFVSPQRNGQPQLDERPPPPDNPLARQDASAVYFRNSPSLLLTSLPGQIERGLTNAQKLLAENKQLHASGGGQHQVQTRVTTLIGPSGAGKTRTALEALCHEYGFYMSFSTEKEPGTDILREAIHRLRESYRGEYAAAQGDGARLQEFRDNRLHDMRKFIARMLLAYTLGLREYLSQHGNRASPRGFLLFQLIGIVGQEDWLLKTWDCLLSLSEDAVEQKLQTTMEELVEELKRRTEQATFNVFVDEAQAGTRELQGYFPSRDKAQGRPLLNGWVRSLHHSIFARFHFNLTGTGLSLQHAQQLETAVGEMGAAQLSTFTNFTRFSLNDALEYAQVYLQSPPENVKVHILVGRPRFAAQLVQAVLLLGKSWKEALQFVEELHTRQDVPTSLLKGLHEAKAKLSGNDFTVLVEELQNLVLGYYIIGRGVPTDKASVDMIEVGVCHLAYLGRPGECTMVTLVEPLAAMAATNFLATEAHWLLDTKQLNMIRLSPSDSAMGALFERIIPRAQLRLATSDCLASHPLFKEIEGLPACFKKRARMECLLGQGHQSIELTLEDRLHVEACRPGRGLLDFLREPNGTASYFPEEGAGPDNGSFIRIGDERWLPIVQAKCRKKVPNKAHALGSLEMRTMFKGERDPERKRQEFKDLLRQRGVTGILQILLAYPAEVNVSSFAKSRLRRSPRFQQSEEDEFDFVQVCVSRSNAEHYLLPEERRHLDCLKDV